MSTAFVSPFARRSASLIVTRYVPFTVLLSALAAETEALTTIAPSTASAQRVVMRFMVALLSVENRIDTPRRSADLLPGLAADEDPVAGVGRSCHAETKLAVAERPT